MITVFGICKSKFFIQQVMPLLKADGIEVIALCQDSAAAVSQYRQLHVDIVMMDLNWAHSSYALSGVELVQQLKIQNSAIKIIGTTNYDDAPLFEKFTSLGVQGFFSRDLSYMQIINCIEQVHEGSGESPLVDSVPQVAQQ